MNFNVSESIFETSLGERLYQEACRAIEDFRMDKMLSCGVLVGLSGGSDSVFLLAFLIEYRRRNNSSFKIVAAHVNHGIRGEEAERDEAFSAEFANSCGVEFIACKVSAPTEAKEASIGLEEAARNLRYKAFDEIIGGRNDISCVALAHNAGDNLETVIFNMLRGTGTKGVSGISPVRENIVRPIIYISKFDIEQLLNETKTKYVYDSTNFSCEYTRNYIRHEIVPLFKRISANPEKSVTRMSENLRTDNSFIEQFAENFLNNNMINGEIAVTDLADLHPAPFFRVIAKMAYDVGCASIEYVHVKKIRELLPKADFTLSLPQNHVFISERGKARIQISNEKEDFYATLSLGENVVPGFDDIILVSNDKNDKIYSNVYKISIQAKLPFDIINKVLFVRSRLDGDKYRYGGITHKIKKLFNDKKVPMSRRSDVPIFCDEKGIVWVPGFAHREGKADGYVYVSILQKNGSDVSDRHFYIP